MYSIQRHSNNACYETMNYIRQQQQQQKSVFNNRQMIKNNSAGTFHRSPLLSFCVPDVYSPGTNGKCSLPPPSSNLPPPPSEWLN
ncbi:unnamed protein product [Adineta steineri]|uniref:Uncharacterized protein n=2 Tax=Adineta steineri TaxID=433720 RepID=A0A815FKZ0_9BILA|nr:unnamed protein product [Adineta steineri]CAF3761867.1 unnamed protein product [Adineta steineri]